MVLSLSNEYYPTNHCIKTCLSTWFPHFLFLIAFLSTGLSSLVFTCICKSVTHSFARHFYWIYFGVHSILQEIQCTHSFLVPWVGIFTQILREFNFVLHSLSLANYMIHVPCKQRKPMQISHYLTSFTPNRGKSLLLNFDLTSQPLYVLRQCTLTFFLSYAINCYLTACCCILSLTGDLARPNGDVHNYKPKLTLEKNYM